MAVNIGPRIGIEGEAEYRKQLNNIIQQTKTLHSEMRSMESAWNKDTSAKEKAAQQTRMLNQQIDTQKQRIDELRKGVEQSAAAYGENDTKTLKWKQALADAETELHRLQSELQKVPNNVQLLGQSMQETGKKMQEVGKGISSVGSTLTKSVTAPITALSAAAVKVTADFDSSMSKVAALSGATGTEFEALRQKARDMGASTKYSAGEAADALSYMALAGWDTNQMIDGLDGVLNLAAASGMELAEASDLVTDYLSAFGLEASDSSRMADQLAYAQAHSNTTTTQLGEAFGNTAAQMHTAGQSMETTTAILEAFANQGLKGSEAGTALSAMVRDITQRMQDGKIYIGETAVTVQDANGNFRNMIDILADVEEATDGMGSAEKSAALMTTFTARSVKGVSMALTEGSDNIQSYADDLTEAGGTAKEMADTMQDNLSGQLTILKSQVQELGISFGDILVPQIRSGVSWVQEQVDKFNRLDKSTKENIVKFGLLAAAVGPVLGITGKLVESTGKMVETGGKVVEWVGKMIAGHAANTAAKVSETAATEAATAAQVGLNTAMSMSPIGAVALAITGAVAAILALKAGYEKAKQAALEENEALAASVSATEKATDAMNKAADSVKTAYDDAVDSIGQATAMSSRAEELTNRITDLNDKTRLTAEEQALMKASVQELTSIYPGLSVEIDETTGKLKQSSAEIRNMVSESEKAMKIAAYNKIIEASTDALIEATQAKVRADYEAKRASEEVDKENETRKQQIDDLKERMKSMTDAEREQFQAQLNSLESNKGYTLAAREASETLRAQEDAAKALTAAEEELNGMRETAADSLGITIDEVNEFNAATEESADAMEGAGDETQALITDTGELAEEMGNSADEISDYAKEIIDAYNSTAESAQQSVMEQKGMFEELEAAEEKSIADMVTGLQSHVTAYQSWNSNVSTLMNSTRYQTDEGFRNMVNSVASAGVDMAPELQAIVTAFQNGDAQLEDLVNGYGNLQQLSVETGQNTAMATTMLQYGLTDMSAAFAEGGVMLEGAASEMVNAATRPIVGSTLPGDGVILAQNTVNGMSSALNSSAPAAAVGSTLENTWKSNQKTAWNVGVNVANKVGGGMKDSGEIQAGGNAIKGEVNTALTDTGNLKTNAQTTGSEIARSLSNGINSSKPLVVSAMNALKTAVSTGLVNVKGLSSTAKTNGSGISSNLAAGINSNKASVTTAMSGLKTEVTNGLDGVGYKAKTAGSSVSSNFASGISSNAGTVSTVASSIATNASTPLSNLQKYSEKWGSDFGLNFNKGLASTKKTIVDTARDIANAVKNVIGHSTPKEGPMKNDDVWGLHMGQNFARGMIQSIPLIQTAALDMASAAMLNPTVDAAVITGSSQASPLTADVLFEAFSAALSQADLSVVIGNREFRRVLRENGAIA